MTVIKSKALKSTQDERSRQSNTNTCMGDRKRTVQAVLALDLGTNMGYAIRHVDGRVTYGTKQFSPKHGRGQRWLTFRSWLNDVITLHGVDVVAYEDVKRHSGVIAAHVYGGMLAILEMTTDQHAIPMSGHGVGAIKKNWTGKGNAKKDLMIQSGFDRGYQPMDDNAADALAILHYELLHQT